LSSRAPFFWREGSRVCFAFYPRNPRSSAAAVAFAVALAAGLAFDLPFLDLSFIRGSFLLSFDPCILWK